MIFFSPEVHSWPFLEGKTKVRLVELSEGQQIEGRLDYVFRGAVIPF